ncbi:hypothetical protein HEP_00169100, partial [Hepatocystis sp. ex Piliocolobus tephrosceles]
KFKRSRYFFDGELCNFDLTFDNEELELEDGFQIDIKFPLASYMSKPEEDLSLDVDSYVLFLPDSYCID